MPLYETPTDWNTMTNEQKKTLVKFVAGGLAAVIIGKLETIINKKADEYFEDTPEVKA